MVALVLARDGRPHRVVPDRKALALVTRGAAVVLEADADVPIRTAGGVAHPRPAVVCLVRHVAVPDRPPRWSKSGVLTRDGHRCAYCGASARTVDHIYPQHLCRAEGRHPDTWENTVAACEACQHRKAGLTLTQARMDFRPGVRPHRPRALPVRLGASLVARFAQYLKGQ